MSDTQTKLGDASHEGKDRPKRQGDFWKWTERGLVLVGLALLAFLGIARLDSILSSKAALHQLASHPEAAQTMPEATVESRSAVEKLLAPEVDFTSWDQHRVQAYQQSTQPATPLAVLRIPKVDLEAPVLEGTDDLTLNRGVGRIAGTARPGGAGNIGIAGHRDSFFRGLKKIRTGDAIELQTSRGTDRYVVDQIQIVTPEHVEVLQPREVPSLTLVTCYPFYFIGSAPQRYIVTASLAREISSSSQNFDVRSGISNEGEKQ